MDPVQRNDLLMRAAMFLFGCVCYLYLMVMGLMRLREAPIRVSLVQLRKSGWHIALFLVFGALCIVASLLPSTQHLSAYEIAKDRIAPVVLGICAVFFIGYVGWVAYQVVETIRWLIAGRPRPPARHIPDVLSHAPDSTPARAPAPRRTALTPRARAPLRLGRHKRHHLP